MPGAFHGVRVVEFAEGVAAPFAAMLLAEQGADVIKAERPAGDRARALPGFQVWNRSKRGATVRSHSAAGAALLRDLAISSDIFIWDRTQDEARAEGVDAATLCAVNPHLVYLAMPPYGERGPHARRFGDEALVAAFNGVFAQQPTFGGGPGYVVTPWSSIAAGILGAAAAAMGLYHRARSGWAGVIQLPGIAGGLVHLVDEVLEVRGEPLGSWQPHPYGAFPLFAIQPCADGFLALGVSAPRQWHTVAIGMGHPEWISDPRFADAPWGLDLEAREELRAMLHAEFRKRPVQHWLETLGPLDAPVGPISTREAYIEDEQVRHNGMRVEIEVPGLGRTVQMGVPIWFSETPGAIQRRAPLPGEHTEEVAREAAALARSGRPILRTGHDDPSAPPLAGVRVIEFNAYTAGPYAGGLLAGFGADVVRVEPPDGDPTRQAAYTWFTFNGRKRAVNVNLRDPEVLARVREGIAGFDVLLENNRPGVLHRLGIGYEDLAPAMPGLVFASSCGWGKDGPRAQDPSFDILVQARAGWLAAQGNGPREPVYTTNLIADFGGALQNVFMVAAALYARERTGRGQWVMSVLGNSTMVMQAGDFISWEGKPATHAGGRDVRGLHPAYRLYECGHGRWLFLACSSEAEWLRLAGLADAGPDPLPWGSVKASRPEGEPAPFLHNWFARQDRDGAVARLDAAGVPSGPVYAGHELSRHPQLELNGLVMQFQHPVHGMLRTLAPVASFQGIAPAPPGVDPGLGEHTRELLLAWGARPAEIERWSGAGAAVIGGPVRLG